VKVPSATPSAKTPTKIPTVAARSNMIAKILKITDAPLTILAPIQRCLEEASGYKKEQWDGILKDCGLDDYDRGLMVSVMEGRLVFPSLLE
jgi:hypothetical protein